MELELSVRDERGARVAGALSLLGDVALLGFGARALAAGEPSAPFLLAFGAAGSLFGLSLLLLRRRVRLGPDGVEERLLAGVPLRTRHVARATLEAVTLERVTRHGKHGTYHVFEARAVGTGRPALLRATTDEAAALEDARRAAGALGLPLRDLRPTPEQLAAWKEPSSRVGLMILAGVVLFVVLAVAALAVWG